MEVAGASNTLAEGQSIALHAVVRYDDGSDLAGGFDPVWIVADGPLYSSGAGWMTAQPVYQDTPATAQASVFSLTGSSALTVLNSDPDNYGLYANDDIDDAWQVAHYGPSNVWGLADADYDGDDADNYYEFTSGTDPLSAGEFFALKSIRRGSGVEVGIGPLETNRIYTVERAMLLSAGSWSGYTNISLSAPSNLLVLTNAETGTNMAFYRVAIRYPWRNSP